MDWAAQMDSAARVRSDLGWSRSSLRGVSGSFFLWSSERGELMRALAQTWTS